MEAYGDGCLTHERFMELLRTNYEPIYSTVLVLTGNDADADDVMQDVIVVLWRKFEEFEPDTNFRAWARAIAVNVSREFSRKKRKANGFGLSDAAVAKLAQAQTTRNELLELRREQLQLCLKKLSHDDQSFLWRCYAKDTRVIDIARQYDCPPSTVYNRLGRIRKKLSDCINRSLGRQGQSLP